MRIYVKNNKIYGAFDSLIFGLVPFHIPQDACMQLLYYIEEIYVDPAEQFEVLQSEKDDLEYQLAKANDEIERLQDIVEDLKHYSGLDVQEKLYGPLR